MLSSSCDWVTDFEVIDPDINFSDHLLIMLTCVCSAYNSFNEYNNDNVSPTKLPTQYRWDHADLLSYYSYTGLWLQPILSNIENIEGADSDDVCSKIDSLYENIASILNSATNVFVPQHKKSFHKFWRDEEMSSLMDESIESNKLWKAAGKPRHGPIFEKRQSCRLRYHKRI